MPMPRAGNRCPRPHSSRALWVPTSRVKDVVKEARAFDVAGGTLAPAVPRSQWLAGWLRTPRSSEVS